MTLSVGKEEIKKINCCDKCRAWSMKFKSDVYPCHNTDCECHISTPVLSKPVERSYHKKFYEFTCNKCGYSVAEYVPPFRGSQLAGNPCPKCETSGSFIFEGSL